MNNAAELYAMMTRDPYNVSADVNKIIEEAANRNQYDKLAHATQVARPQVYKTQHDKSVNDTLTPKIMSHAINLKSQQSIILPQYSIIRSRNLWNTTSQMSHPKDLPSDLCPGLEDAYPGEVNCFVHHNVKNVGGVPPHYNHIQNPESFLFSQSRNYNMNPEDFPFGQSGNKNMKPVVQSGNNNMKSYGQSSNYY